MITPSPRVGGRPREVLYAIVFETLFVTGAHDKCLRSEKGLLANARNGLERPIATCQSGDVQPVQGQTYNVAPVSL